MSTSPVPSVAAFKVQEKYEAGVRLLQNGYVLAAIQQFQEASFFDAEDALPIVALAECYVFLCDLRSAIRCYHRALWLLHRRKQSKAQPAVSTIPVSDANDAEDEVEKAASPPSWPSLSRDALHAVAQGRVMSSEVLRGERVVTVCVDAPADEQAAERQPAQSSHASSVSPQADETSQSLSGDVPAEVRPLHGAHRFSQEGTATASRELTASAVRRRLVGVLDALGLALFQAGSVEQALRCTTEALELLATADAQDDEEVEGGAQPRGFDGGLAAVGPFTKRPDPYLSQPIIALHRAVFLIALQREEEAELLLDRHYEVFEDYRAQSAPLLIQLHCNRHAFQKARLLLESQEGSFQRAATCLTGEDVPVPPAAEPIAAAANASIPARSGSAYPTQEEDAKRGSEGAPLSLTVAKYIFTESYARYRSAALASDNEDSVTRCLDVYPNDVDLLFRRAQLRIAAGELKRSIKDLFRCVKDTNGEHKAAIEAMTSVLFAIGSNLDGESELQNAVAYYSESLKWRPDNLLVLLARGDCYTKMEAFEDALADYQAILNYAPGHRQAQGRIAALHDLWGRKFFAMDNAAQAETEYTNAIKMDSTNPEFYYHRALCRLKLNQGRYALRDVLSCKELNPSAPHLRAFIARYLEPIQSGEEAEAVQSGESASVTNSATRRTAAPADGRRHASNMAKPSAAARWYGSRTPPPLPLPSPVGGRHTYHGEDAGGAMSPPPPPLPSRSVSVALPLIGARATASSAPPRNASSDGWVLGYQTTLHRRGSKMPPRTK